MILFKTNKKHFKTYLLEMVWFSFKPLIILAIICIILFLGFLFATFIFDKGFLTYAYISLVFFLIFLLYPVEAVFIYKRVLDSFFEDSNADGDIESSISLDNDELLIENLSRKTVSKIKLCEIKRVKVIGKTIFIKTKVNGSLFFPKSIELYDFFNNNIYKNSKHRLH